MVSGTFIFYPSASSPFTVLNTLFADEPIFEKPRINYELSFLFGKYFHAGFKIFFLKMTCFHHRGQRVG
jgi:hypothetical protein